MCDNITVSPWGDIIICEDGGGVDYLVGIRHDGTSYKIAKNALFAPKSRKPHFVIRVRRFLMFLGSQNAFLRSKRVLAPLLHFGTPKPSRNVDHV